MSLGATTGIAMSHAGPVAATVLARDADGPEFGKASPLGLLLVLLLLVGTVFLIRSMNRHLRNLPSNFSREDPGADQAADEGTDPAGVAPSTPSADGADGAPPSLDTRAGPDHESEPTNGDDR